jgi:hypothetical protein
MCEHVEGIQLAVIPEKPAWAAQSVWEMNETQSMLDVSSATGLPPKW